MNTRGITNKAVQELAAIGLIVITLLAVAGLVYGVVFDTAGKTDPLTSVAGIGVGALAVLAGAKRGSDE